MKRAKSVFPIFFLLLLLSVLILFSQGSVIKPLQFITLPIQKWTFTTFSKIPLVSNENEAVLRDQNNALRTQVAKMQELERENKSLREQFQVSEPKSQDLLPATVIGSAENQLLIDKGQDEGVQVGDIVVLKDNLVGKIAKVSPHVSMVTLITHPSTSFTAQTAKTASIGVVKAQGEEGITFENVTLSDKLEKDDVVLTKGDMDEKGRGFPPKLVVGKVVSINKKASSLFQNAQIKSLVEFGAVRMVFVKTQ